LNQLRNALERELSVYGKTVALARGALPVPSGAATPLARWLDWLVPYVRARLARALQVEDGDLPDLLLRHRARVFVSAVNVDVVLTLADLPIAIRLCGLDRDPGWIPAANRVVAFRFD
jgi:hypothetical protein